MDFLIRVGRSPYCVLYWPFVKNASQVRGLSPLKIDYEGDSRGFENVVRKSVSWLVRSGRVIPNNNMTVGLV